MSAWLRVGSEATPNAMTALALATVKGSVMLAIDV
jgi:hypothetical protein